MTGEELALVDDVTDRYGRASGAVCEWCGRPGSLGSDRPEWLTLCDPCVLHVAAYPRAEAEEVAQNNLDMMGAVERVPDDSGLSILVSQGTTECLEQLRAKPASR